MTVLEAFLFSLGIINSVKALDRAEDLTAVSASAAILSSVSRRLPSRVAATAHARFYFLHLFA